MNPGGLQSPKDARDFKLSTVYKIGAAVQDSHPDTYLPDISNLPTYNQGSHPSCTCNAIAWGVSYLNSLREKSTVPMTIEPNPRFAWALCKRDDGLDPSVQGTYFRQPLVETQKVGIANIDPAYPNDTALSETDYRTLPSASEYDSAELQKIDSYARVDDMSWEGLKNAIYNNGVVFLGLYCDSQWWNPPYNGTEPLGLPKQQLGHMVVAYAYDNNIYIKNSFGSSWGKNGVGILSPDYLPFIYEAWTAVDMTEDDIAKIKQERSLLTQAIILIQQIINAIRNQKQSPAP